MTGHWRSWGHFRIGSTRKEDRVWMYSSWRIESVHLAILSKKVWAQESVQFSFVQARRRMGGYDMRLIGSFEKFFLSPFLEDKTCNCLWRRTRLTSVAEGKHEFVKRMLQTKREQRTNSTKSWSFKLSKGRNKIFFSLISSWSIACAWNIDFMPSRVEFEGRRWGKMRSKINITAYYRAFKSSAKSTRKGEVRSKRLNMKIPTAGQHAKIWLRTWPWSLNEDLESRLGNCDFSASIQGLLISCSLQAACQQSAWSIDRSIDQSICITLS